MAFGAGSGWQLEVAIDRLQSENPNSHRGPGEREGESATKVRSVAAKPSVSDPMPHLRCQM